MFSVLKYSSLHETVLLSKYKIFEKKTSNGAIVIGGQNLGLEQDLIFFFKKKPAW